ncbi:PhzF family phenazine biosynthesis protein [Baekduia soli]|uniref:PhzF family phenazine biosynthesis protein n=1 Tax=Baekduia soli TaxID=496014 RepID=A0A5B8U1H5_9ACTN|nr:PhzF family phenazine biosynthesis protein [Baekduia soli]QEC46924.1 PhzF family phenazine biosynthesis protein [Baekduia soli]
MRPRPFVQVDVFSAEPLGGNPVAVVLDAGDLDTEAMQRLARWTNLSETTFVLTPTTPEADYRVRIFTPSRELPFAGHPTLGTAHAWSAGVPGREGRDRLVQECAAGLVPLRRDTGGRLAFAAPPTLRSGPVEPALAAEVVAALGLERERVLDLQWADNGPGWIAVLVDSAATALAVQPAPIGQDVGIVALCAPGDPEAIEVRAFFPGPSGAMLEDPVTGSFNASVAQWLLGSGRLAAPYVARQGTVLGRAGRIHVDRDEDGTVWIGGDTTTVLAGTATV